MFHLQIKIVGTKNSQAINYETRAKESVNNMDNKVRVKCKAKSK